MHSNLVQTLHSLRHLTLTLLLGPILYRQGTSARRRVPVLPEAAGERRGRSGKGPLLRLLIVGDSAAAGVGAPDQDQALLGRTVSNLGAHFEVEWTLLARSGDATPDALERLSSLGDAHFDVAVTSLGVNDVIARSSRSRWRAQQTELRRRLKKEYGATLVIACGLPPVYGFPALPQPLRWYLGARAKQFDRDLEYDVGSDAGCIYLGLHFATDASLMAVDGFHPGPRIYTAWGEKLAHLVMSTLDARELAGAP